MTKKTEWDDYPRESLVLMLEDCISVRDSYLQQIQAKDRELANLKDFIKGTAKNMLFALK